MGINQMLSRDGRIAERIPGRDEFTGPADGTVELPNRLCWSGSDLISAWEKHLPDLATA